MEKIEIFDVGVHVTDFETALDTVSDWSAQGASRKVVFCNVHSLMSARNDAGFLEVLNGADLVLPDGAPVAFLMRRLGFRRQARISGPDFMWRYLAKARDHGESLFLFGGTETTLRALSARLQEHFPGLRIAGTCSPPFRPPTLEETRAHIRMIEDSGARTVWVSLGCPKQERWMMEEGRDIQAILLGVGAAFNYHAGLLPRAPVWMQSLGFEWAYRLFQQPGTLWRRYLSTNSQFLYLLFRAFIRKMSGFSGR